MGWRGDLTRKARGAIGGLFNKSLRKCKRGKTTTGSVQRPVRSSTSERELEDALQVIGLRKQIHQVRPFDPVTGSQQDYEIARQGRGIARHIGQASRA